MKAASVIGVLVVAGGLTFAQGAPKQPEPSKPADAKPGDAPRQPRQPRQPRTTGKPAADAPAKKPEPMWGPWVVRERPNDIMVQVRLSVRSDSPKQKDTFRDPQTGKTVQMPRVTPFAFEAVSVVWPYLTNTASSDLLGETKPWPDGDIGEVGYKGRLMIAERIVDIEPTIVDGLYHAGTKLGSWQAPKEEIDRVKLQAAGGIREVELTVEYPVRCYRVKFDEDAAMSVGWPGEWPAVAASALQPQMWVEKGVNEEGKVAEYDREQIKKVLEKYLKEEGIDDAKKVAPVRLAKILTGKVWRDVAPTAGSGVKDTSRKAGFEGFEVRAPAVTFEDGKGSPHDMVVALVALLREAGLPARLVIGLDEGSGGGGLGGSRAQVNLRSWLEFAVFDESANALCWVPVDILKLRKISNKPQKIDVTWRYFGNNDELDQVAPIAFHFTPPADGVVTYGSPEMWGWMVFPKAPDEVEATVVFAAAGVPKKASKELKEVEPLKVVPVERK
jgi:hypothetical protein